MKNVTVKMYEEVNNIHIMFWKGVVISHIQ